MNLHTNGKAPPSFIVAPLTVYARKTGYINQPRLEIAGLFLNQGPGIFVT